MSTESLENSFSKLLGRQPTETERQQLSRVKSALGLKDNDALWLIIMALQYYDDKYKRIPKEINYLTESTLNRFKESSEYHAGIAAKLAYDKTKDKLEKTVVDVAHEIAHKVAGKQKLQWIAISVVVVSISFGVFGYYMNKIRSESGYAKGYGIGYSESKDEKAAAAWANTPQGRQAYSFAQTVDFNNLAKCNSLGWTIKKNEKGEKLCIPYPAPDKSIYGWHLSP